MAMANRAADWLHQASQDLEQAQLSAAHGHHAWACFAAHQARPAIPIAFQTVHPEITSGTCKARMP